MVREPGRSLATLTFVLVGIACVATEIAAADSDEQPLGELMPQLGLVAVWIGLAAVTFRLTRQRMIRADQRLPWPYALALAVVFFAPLAVEPYSRSWFDFGRPLEMQLIIGFRNLALGFAALSAGLLGRRCAVMISLFLMLFAISMCTRPVILFLTLAYGLTGALWLSFRYRDKLRQSAATDARLSGFARPLPARVPVRALVLLTALVAAAIIIPAVGPDRAAAVLGELMPTSGGTGEQDPYSRGGVNDGPEETAGSNPMSTGFVETDQFLDSPLPSLYDMSTDFDGEPRKPREQERAIALSHGQVRELPKPPPDSRRPSRSFSTHRQSPRRPRSPDPRAARALFEVEGRTPLHVRVLSYDFFDGFRWHEASPGTMLSRINRVADGDWMELYWGAGEPIFFADDDRHAFKIAALEGSLLPTPPQLTYFQVGQVDRPDWFEWRDGHGILIMASRSVPSGVTVETQCRTIDPDRLGEVKSWGFADDQHRYCQLPDQLLDPRVAELARRWTAGRPRGWTQVQAVTNGLRSGYQLDPDYREPEDCNDPLAHFLFESRRGPDYQFAGAAAILLRSLGYPTRVTHGFYVAPEHFDDESGHTPVVSEDLHWWPELRLPNGDWLVLEPTPGYGTLGPRWHWTRQVAAALRSAWLWALAHPIIVGLILVGTVLMVFNRRSLFDRLLVWKWRFLECATWRQCVLGACRLLERRSRWAGNERGAGETVTAWVSHRITDECGASLAELYRWAAFAPAESPPRPTPEILQTCREAVTRWTPARFRAALNEGMNRA